MPERGAIVLTSGGLDSLLAMKILEREGIRVTGLHLVTWFNLPKYKMFDEIPEYEIKYGIKIYNIDVSEDYTSILLNPKYGYGSSVNPCIDCKILFFSKAKELMGRFKADFVATGEVVGQRPMTQNLNSIKLIEKKSNLSGYVVRPLCAKLLDPTVPEIKGWINREHLYDISGRGRKRQMELAVEYGIDNYPSPAGGCILTEKNFAPRFYDLIKNIKNPSVIDFLTLRYGRHFRLPDGAKLIVGKNKAENDFLGRLPWGNLQFELIDVPGPLCLIDWKGYPGSLRLAVTACIRYSDYKDVEQLNYVKVKIKKKDNNYRIIKLKPVKGIDLKSYMIV